MAENRELLFQTRKVSFFDICESDSGVLKEQMRGLYLFFTVCSGVYLVSSFYMRLASSEPLFYWDRLNLMLEDIDFVMFLIPCFFAYSFVAFMIEKMILSGLPVHQAEYLQHGSQCLMFLFTTYCSLFRPWWITQIVFINFLTFIFFMKMHSYLSVNRDLREEKDRNSEANKYPENVTLKNYIMYLLFPVLVYQPSYARTSGFRPSYFCQKMGLLVLRMLTLHFVFEEYFVPVILNKEGFWYISLVFRSMVPAIVFYILLFIIIFEDILNIFAEITLFADRRFYADWWNAINYEEFNRKWNRPVYYFLYKHVYLECINKYACSKVKARYITFLFSAVCHEYIMAMTFHKISPYLFGLMMYQFPLVFFQRFVESDTLRILVFWLTMMLGPGLLVSFYTISLSS